MDQIKIGKFIAERRKSLNLTQMQLAEKLGITDRAISKWENGKAMPDSAIMLELCEILQISVNDLLHGEVISMENYNKELENTLVDLVNQKVKNDKRLLDLQVVMCVTSIAYYLAMIVLAAYLPMAVWLRIVLIVAGLVPVIVCIAFAMKIEQIAGYYECKECKHRYVPTLKAINMAPHMGRTRHMKCPACGKKTWQKKVLSK